MRDKDQARCLSKFMVSQDEHDLIRLAAALRRTSMADFARQIVISEARKVVTSLSPPSIESGVGDTHAGSA